MILCLQVRQTGVTVGDEKSSQERNFLPVLESSCPAVLNVSCTNTAPRKVCVLLRLRGGAWWVFCACGADVGGGQKCSLSVTQRPLLLPQPVG